MTSTVPGKGYTVCSFIDSPNKYLLNSYYIPKNPGDTMHSFIHSFIQFNKQFLGACYVLQAAPCFLSLRPHSQPHPNQSQLLLALSHLHALALVPEMPLLYPGQTPTHPARAQFKTFLLGEAFPISGSPHPKPTWCFPPTREYMALNGSDLFLCRVCVSPTD